MSLNEIFNKATEDVKELSSQPSDADLLELYSLFKQGTIGDCNTPKPSMLDFKRKAKWNAWDGKRGMSQDTAKQQYIEKVNELVSAIGMK